MLPGRGLKFSTSGGFERRLPGSSRDTGTTLRDVGTTCGTCALGSSRDAATVTNSQKVSIERLYILNVSALVDLADKA